MTGFPHLDQARRGHSIRVAIRQERLAARKARDDSDVKLFLLSFTAFFICFYTFLL